MKCKDKKWRLVAYIRRNQESVQDLDKKLVILYKSSEVKSKIG